MAESVEASGDGVLRMRNGEPITRLQVSEGIATGRPFQGFTYSADRILFGGIENEGRVIGAGALATSASYSFTNGVPRVVLPDAATTDCYAVFALEEWWLNSTIAVYIEYVNDAAGTGDVVWNCELKEIDIGTQGPATGGTAVATTLEAVAAPAAGLTSTYTVCSQVKGNSWTPSPGPFASFYSLRITRIGANGSDTLAGSLGIIEVSYVRGQ